MSPRDPQTSSDVSAYTRRRTHLSELMQAAGGGVAIVATAAETLRNADTPYPFRHDSYFYYLSGFTEPEAVLVIIAAAEPRSILFCRDRNPEREIWDGFRHGTDGAIKRFGFDEAYPIEQLDTLMPGLLANQSNLFMSMAGNAWMDEHVASWRTSLDAQIRSGVTAPNSLKDIRLLLDQMRLYKDALEISLMRHAAGISSAAHVRAMRATKAGRHEYEIEAELLAEFRRQGADSPAYPSIVAGGANACTLHYIANNGMLREGELLLIDAGCEFGSYASDITRTFPVSGRFSEAQRAVYQLVLDAQQAALSAVAPGQSWNAAHEAATRTLAQGLIELGILGGTLDDAIETGSYREFFMHRTGHWLGLDVHDVGDYHESPSAQMQGTQRPWRALQSGMTLTVEPGLYIRPREGIDEKYWNIGIRIEDDVLVTDNGYAILSEDCPKSIEAVEAIMRSRP
jgi:Xaa-Pro aminopeptidase